MTAPPSVCCVLVNWNGWRDTLACLDSLTAQDYEDLQVIVVDNGSTNDSVERIREAHPSVTLIETGENLGFPSGCNVGIRAAYAGGADYMWLLNNDTVAPPDTASKLVRAAMANPKAGAVGAVLRYMHDPGRVQAWGGGRVNLWAGYAGHYLKPAKFNEKSYLTGASMVVPRKAVEDVGVLYEGFFMYCDDSDYCFRLRRAGYSLAIAEDTAILHKEGGSGRQASLLMNQFATTSMLRLLRRHAPVPPFSMAIFLALRFGKRLLLGRWRSAASVLRGIRVFVRERNAAFSERL